MKNSKVIGDKGLRLFYQSSCVQGVPTVLPVFCLFMRDLPCKQSPDLLSQRTSSSLLLSGIELNKVSPLSRQLSSSSGIEYRVNDSQKGTKRDMETFAPLSEKTEREKRMRKD